MRGRLPWAIMLYLTPNRSVCHRVFRQASALFDQRPGHPGEVSVPAFSQKESKLRLSLPRNDPWLIGHSDRNISRPIQSRLPVREDGVIYSDDVLFIHFEALNKPVGEGKSCCERPIAFVIATAAPGSNVDMAELKSTETEHWLDVHQRNIAGVGYLEGDARWL